MEKLLLTPEQAAEALSISRTMLYELIKEDADAPRLVSLKIKGLRRIDAADLRTYVNELKRHQAGG